MIAARDTTNLETMQIEIDSLGLDSMQMVDSLADNLLVVDSTAVGNRQQSSALLNPASQQSSVVIQNDTIRKKFFSDSVSLSRMCWTATVLPGYGQIYNKEYWKLPIIYGALATGVALFINENNRYKPLKAEYDDITLTDTNRTDYLNELQGSMIRSNTRRQIYLGATIGTYIYAIGDAAIKYSTNNTSDIKRATTLSTICPGAGQVYNKSYWKVPFVVGGFASMIYVVDWNNRGYQRFKKAYTLMADYETNTDNYPDGSVDEFSGQYSSSDLQSIRDSYRRNRDLSIIMLTGLYILQIIDAHVDAHLKDYDISDDLSMNIEPLVGTTYSPSTGNNYAMYGFNIGITF